jgi:hypothetical protein
MRWQWVRKEGPWWLLLGWVYLYIVRLCAWRVDPDFGWHYRTGEYILRHGIPMRDVFSYPAHGFAWVNHEWLADILMYGVAAHWGYAVLGIMYAAIWTAAFALSLRHRRDLALVGLALAAVMPYVGIRGVAMTALGLAVVLRVIEGSGRHYFWLASLTLLWANLHAGFAIGLAMVGLRVVMTRDRRLAAWLGASLLLSLINPYGWGIYLELWRTMSDGKLAGYIVEWAPLAVNQSIAPYVVILAVVIWLWPSWDFRRVRAAILLGAALWSNRHVPLMVVGTLEMMSMGLERGWRMIDRLAPRVPPGVVGRPARYVVALGLGIGLPVSLFFWPPQIDPGGTLARPVAELSALKAEPCRGHLFNDYSYGGLIIWSLPGVETYIDGRMPSWSGPEGRYLDRYVDVLKGGETTSREFGRYNIQCAVISKLDKKLDGWLAQQSGWRVVTRADDARLWRRD